MSSFISIKYSERNLDGIIAMIINAIKQDTLYDKNYGTYDLSKKDNDIEKQPNATQLKMIELIKLNPRITQKNMATEVGLSIHTIKKNVGILKNANILERKGSKKDGYWIIKK